MARQGDYGECVVTRIDDPATGTRLRIDRADPRILISGELLTATAENPRGWPVTFDGEVLRIRGVNQTVVYRVRTGGPGAYIGEFPD